jgi:CheY-like chemotaxis protein/signal transduction histidine kinase
LFVRCYYCNYNYNYTAIQLFSIIYPPEIQQAMSSTVSPSPYEDTDEDTDVILPVLQSNVEVEELPKNRWSVQFKDKDTQQQFLEFGRNQLHQQGIKTIKTFVYCFFLLTTYLKFFVFNQQGLSDIIERSLYYSLVSFIVHTVSIVLGLVFLFLQCFKFGPFFQRLLGSHYTWIKVYAQFISMFLHIVGLGFLLVGKIKAGDCEPDEDLLCIEYAGKIAGNLHDNFTFIVITPVWVFLINHGLVPYRHLVISNVASLCLVVWVILIENVNIGAALFRNIVHMLGIVLLCQSFIYTAMFTFEYHIALQKTHRNQLLSSQLASNAEKHQLKMVLANVAHDLKTPLQAFGSGLSLLEKLVPTKDLQANVMFAFVSLLRDMEASYAFMTMQINRALDVSKMGCDIELRPKLETVFLKDIVSWAFSIMTSIQCGVALEIQSGCEEVLNKHMITDKVWLQENLLCYLSNSVKYSPEDTTVTLVVSVTKAFPFGSRKDDSNVYDGDHLLIEVFDEGVGISDEVSKRLFQPFSQAQRRAGGTGLGLYSLALRIRNLGGVYGLKPREDSSGTVFYFSIPFKEDTSMHDLSSVEEKQIVTNSPTTSLKTETHTYEGSSQSLLELPTRASKKGRINRRSDRFMVLVVDDVPMTVNVLSAAMQKIGAEVSTAKDGFTALQLMKRNLYTAVIMDIQMPIMDGVESVRQLRAWEEEGGSGDSHQQYIIGASACGTSEVRQDVRSVGMNDFIEKPMDIDGLMRKVQVLDEHVDEEIQNRSNSKRDKFIVLLVDDAAVNLKILNRAILSAGAEVVTARDGLSALQLMKRNLYTAVIMDIQMPIMDGVESVRQLRAWEKRGASGSTTRQYVIGASATTDEDIRDEALAVGMDSFVVKPMNISDLIKQLGDLNAPFNNIL